jgi:transcriptional regulator with XRE-family HTH domain
MERNQTNFDKYLERKLEDPSFREHFAAADRAWDIALQLAALRKERGLTQQEVADLLGTKQQAVARLENPAYAGHSLSMIRKYVEALGATIDVTIVPSERLREYKESDCSKPLLAHSLA